MVNFVQHWQSVQDCTVVWMDRRSIHGALWWSTDSNSAILRLRSSKGPWKLETKKIGTV